MMTSKPPLLTFRTAGSPFVRGQQQGRACRERALPWYRRVLDDLTKQVGAPSVAEALRIRSERIRGWREYAEAVDPAGIAECRGIADGLGLDEDAYFAVEFQGAYTAFAPRCTTFGFRDADGRPLLAKTDDIEEHVLGMNVLEIARPEDGYRFAALHFAGSLWAVAGMNERGLAIAMNGIPGPVLEQPGLPSLTALHTILPACATTREACELIARLPVNFYGFALMLGDADGGLALVEKSGAGMAVLPEAPGGYFLHTNHILDAELEAISPPQAENILVNGRKRFRHAEQRLPDLPRTETGLRELCSDRGMEGAIWQQGEDGLFTDFAAVYAPEEHRFTVWTEHPDTVVGRNVNTNKL